MLRGKSPIPRRGVIKITGCNTLSTCKKGSPYSITERRVPELIPVLGSQPAGDLVIDPVVGLSTCIHLI